MNQNKPVANSAADAGSAATAAAAETTVAPAMTVPPAPATEQAAARVTARTASKAVPAADPARRQSARKASAVDETVARHQKVLAEALEQAEAIDYTKPPVKSVGKPAKRGKVARPAKAVRAEKVDKTEKAAKPKKHKLVRDSYAMPEPEYLQIAVLKKRLAGLGVEVKKSEILRGAIAVLAALNDAELQAVVGRVERIKTGRPSKK